MPDVQFTTSWKLGPSVNTGETFFGFDLVNPDPFIETVPEAQLCNRIEFNRGHTPDRAWLLITDATLAQLGETPWTIQILQDQIAQPGAKPVAQVGLLLPGWYLVKMIHVTQGINTSARGLYLLELADIRYIWSRFSGINIDYNVRETEPDTATPMETSSFVSTTLNGGSLWTYNEIILDLFANLGGATTPVVPANTATPEDQVFRSCNAWDALRFVLPRAGMVATRNPFTPSTILVENSDATHPGLAAIQAQMTPYIFDAQATQNIGTVFPEEFLVTFEKAGPKGLADQPTTRTVSSGISGLSGTHQAIQGDLAWVPGSSLQDTNLDVRAAALATAWLNRQQPRKQRQAPGIYFDVSSGETLRPGPQIEKVTIRHSKRGTTTEYVEYPAVAILPEVECLPLRDSVPAVPIPVVEIFDVNSPSTDPVPPLATHCVYPGRLNTNSGVDCAGGTWSAGTAVWIFLMDDDAPSDLARNIRFLGKEEGTFDPGSDERPLYLVQKGNPQPGIVRFETTANAAYGANIPAETVEWNGSAYVTTGTNIGVIDTFDRFGPTLSGAHGFAVARSDREVIDLGGGDVPAYEILWMESAPEHVFCRLNEHMGASNPSRVSADVINYDWTLLQVDQPSGAPLAAGHPPQAQDLTGVSFDLVDIDGSWDALRSGDVVQATLYAPASGAGTPTNKYYITSLVEAECLLYDVVLNSPLQPGHATAVVSTMAGAGVFDGPFSRSLTGANPTVNNTYGLAGEVNDQCLIRRMYKQAGGSHVYELVQVKHKEKLMTEDITVLSTNLNEQRRYISVMHDDRALVPEDLPLPLGGLGGSWIVEANDAGATVVNVGVTTGVNRDVVDFWADSSATRNVSHQAPLPPTVLGQCIEVIFDPASDGTEHNLRFSHHNGWWTGNNFIANVDENNVANPPLDGQNDILVGLRVDSCGHPVSPQTKSLCKILEDTFEPPCADSGDVGKQWALVIECVSFPDNFTCKLVEIKPCP